ncbi:hypothetical protein [Gordonia sp. NPDC003376]
MTPLELLGHAQHLLDESSNATAGNSARLAAMMGRQALEQYVRARCAELNVDYDGRSMRTRLLILRSLDDVDNADRLASLWSQLSACCHQHAYELSPTVTEVRALCEGVIDGIAPRVTPSTPSPKTPA